MRGKHCMKFVDRESVQDEYEVLCMTVATIT